MHSLDKPFVVTKKEISSFCILYCLIPFFLEGLVRSVL